MMESESLLDIFLSMGASLRDKNFYTWSTLEILGITSLLRILNRDS